MDGASSPSNETPPAGAVESMLDRPVAQVAAFVTGGVATWLRALGRPWRFGRQVVSDPARLPPPFAWLVATLITAGVALRVFFAIESVPATAEVSLLSDLRQAAGDVSLMDATLLTFPCVLIVAIGGRLVGRCLGASRRLDDDPVVAATCYAVGWQFGLVTAGFALLIAMQLAGMEPSGGRSDEVAAALPYAAGFALVWGALILGPSIGSVARRTPRWARSGIGFAVGAAALAPIFAATLWTLGQSVDLRAAAEIADARQHRAWAGELEVHLLKGTPMEDFPGRWRLTVAYTSRSNRLIVVPRAERFRPLLWPSRLTEAGAFVLESDPDGVPVRVVDSSLDYLPDRTLLIEPGATRCAEYTVVAPSLGVLDEKEIGNKPVAATFYRREQDGGFLEGVAPLWAPREIVQVAGRAGGPTAR